MRFERIEINNFRAYYGENILNFSVDEKKPLTMIVGDNGGGKSSLMRAIQWCLYGENIPKILHDQAKDNAHVALTFSHEGKKYRAFRRTEGGLSKGLVLHELEGDGRQGKKFQEPQMVINNILPEPLKSWFFYDAEGSSDLSSMDDLDLDGGSETKKALRNIQGFARIDKLIDDLDKIIAQQNKKRIQIGGTQKSKDIQKKIDDLENEIGPLLSNRNSTEDDLELLKKKEKEINDKLLSLPKSKPIKAELANLEPLLVSDNKLYKNKKNKLEMFEASYLPIFLLKKSLDKNQQPRQKKEGVIIVQAPNNKMLVDKIVKDGACICGRPAAPKSKEIEHIRKLLLDKSENDEVNEFNQRASGVTNVLAIIDQKYKSYEAKREEITDELSVVESKIKKNEARIKILNEELTSMGNTDAKVAKLNEDKKVIDSKIDIAMRTYAEKDVLITQKRREQNQLKEELKGADINDDKSKSIRKIIHKAVVIKDYASKKQKEDEIKSLKLLNIDLNKSIAKTSFANIQCKINPENYALNVYDTKTGKPKLNLNSGDVELIKYCLIACVVGQSAKKSQAKNNYLAKPTAAPLVIDAPFTKMGEQYIQGGLDLLLEKAEQLVLFSLPSDFKGYEDKAINKIGKKYAVIRADKGKRGDKNLSQYNIYGKKIDLVVYDHINDDDGESVTQSLIKEII